MRGQCVNEVCGLNMSQISIDGHVTSMVEWNIDLLWYMQFHICVLETLKGHELLPGIVNSIYVTLHEKIMHIMLDICLRYKL